MVLVNRRNLLTTAWAIVAGAVLGSNGKASEAANIEFRAFGSRFIANDRSGLRLYSNDDLYGKVVIGDLNGHIGIGGYDTGPLHIYSPGNVSLAEPNPTAILVVDTDEDWYGAWL